MAEKEIIKELENFWNIKEFVFEAQYAINKKGNGFFRNLRKKEDKSKVFLPNGNQLTVGAPNDLTFEELLYAFEKVLNGGTYLSETVLQMMLDDH